VEVYGVWRVNSFGPACYVTSTILPRDALDEKLQEEVALSGNACVTQSWLCIQGWRCVYLRIACPCKGLGMYMLFVAANASTFTSHIYAGVCGKILQE
jgi:hypothetical protein